MRRIHFLLILTFSSFLICYVGSVYAFNDEGNRAVTSQIFGIVKSQPGNLITDVFDNEVRLTVFVNSFIWGTVTGPSEFFYFSVNDTKKWDNGYIESTNTDPPFAYSIRSSTNLLLDQDTNYIYFYASYWWPDQSNPAFFYDTLVTFQVIYTKPALSILEINGLVFNPEITTVVNHPGDVPFTVKVHSTSNTANPGTFERIIGLEARKKEQANWTTVWQNSNGVVENTVSFNWYEFFSPFDPGLNNIEFRSRGRCQATGCEEYSDVASAKVFYLDMAYGDVISPLFTEDVLKKFQGIPSGGFFNGPGIVEKTGYFNPLSAGIGSHTITYSYLIDETEYSVAKQVSVAAVPTLSQGKQEVCRNEHVYYEISGTMNMNVNIAVQGGKLNKDSDTRGWIHWDGLNAIDQEYSKQLGIISLNLTQPNYAFKYQYLIDITQTPTPDSTLITLVNGDLLVCSYADASYYVWVRNGMVLDTTFVPYYYYPAGNNLQPGDQLWVETAYTAGAFPCFTPSEVLEIGSSSINKKAGLIEIFPNPCKEFATIQINHSGEFSHIELIDLFGRVRFAEPLQNLTNQQAFSFDCNRFEKGIYILRLTGIDGPYTQKIFIGN